MKWLSFAAGVIAGMATTSNNSINKKQRACELNEIGIMLARDYRIEEALFYFREAHKLMPTEFAIKNNILTCKMALRKIDEYKEINKKDNSKNEWKTCPGCGRKLIKVQKKCPYCKYKFN